MYIKASTSKIHLGTTGKDALNINGLSREWLFIVSQTAIQILTAEHAWTNLGEASFDNEEKEQL